MAAVASERSAAAYGPQVTIQPCESFRDEVVSRWDVICVEQLHALSSVGVPMRSYMDVTPASATMIVSYRPFIINVGTVTLPM